MSQLQEATVRLQRVTRRLQAAPSGAMGPELMHEGQRFVDFAEALKATGTPAHTLQEGWMFVAFVC